MPSPDYRIYTFIIAGAFAVQPCAFAENKAEVLETGTIEVVGTTPLPSIGTPVNQVPSNVQAASSSSIKEQKSLDLSEYLDNNLGAVTTNNTVANPFQADVYYRGFAASPLLGTPQGLSIFMDGVRINEPFGDIVNWDLVPANAISSINLLPGSTPLFGLNTLGGALSIHTKSGADNPGVSATASGGSWGRRDFEFEAGGKSGAVDYFVAGNFFNEDGWREHSPSDVKQLFGKAGWQDDKTDIDLSALLADTHMEGTQALPVSMLNRPEQAYTWPDWNANQLGMLSIKGSHFIADDKLISGNAYYRHNLARGFNSNLNNNFDDTVSAFPGDATGNEVASNVLTRTETNGFGAAAQLTLLGDLWAFKNQFTTGLSGDWGRTHFDSDTQRATVDGHQTVTMTPLTVLRTTRLKADNDYYGLYGSDTFSFTDKLHMTLSGRYNLAFINLAGSSLDINDTSLVAGDLNGQHHYERFNPAIGFNYNPFRALGLFAGYNEGMRAPTPVELSCADPAHPCALPNSFSGDPHLKAVVARTWEGGFRGKLPWDTNWNLGFYRTQNSDDIQFISSGGANGYFSNVGKTLRQGLEFGLNGKLDKLSFAANYGFTEATFETQFSEQNESNSSANKTDCAGNATTNNQICVHKGNHIPGIPQHMFKLRLGYEITPSWTIGTNVITASSQYARGDENNQDSHGKVPGYTVMHLDTHYSITDNWKVFAKVNNVFDTKYATYGIVGTNEFNGAGNTFNSTPVGGTAWSNEQFRSPAAPRAGWVGVTYEFGKPKGSASGKPDLD